tara:strand:+ start:421 stop:606 length:186 start_codon:yes stop_codon:yes gene_type:complete
MIDMKVVKSFCSAAAIMEAVSTADVVVVKKRTTRQKSLMDWDVDVLGLLMDWDVDVFDLSG